MKILLQGIQPYLTKKNLPIPAIRKNIYIHEENEHKKVLTERENIPLTNKISKLPVNIATKIVSSNLRDWGRTVDFTRKGLNRKYRIPEMN